jgi:DNA-binding response OmpR family regulator
MGMSALILLVEDNEQILFGNERMLKRRGYDVMTALTLREAKERIETAMPDAIVLDIMLPDGSGLDFMRELRQTSNVPVLLLTGLATPEDIVRGLTEGGDDYLTKPYDFGVFMARVEALLRRTKLLTEVVQKGVIKLNLLSAQAFVNGEDLLLSQKEFAILLLFTQNEEKVIRAEMLSERVWKLPLIGNTQAIKSAISRLRKKLEGSGYTISSLRNEGYLFEKE